MATSGVSKAMEALMGGSVDVAVFGHAQVLQVAAKDRAVKTLEHERDLDGSLKPVES